MLVFSVNLGMLFYIFLFAINQTPVKQRAWAQSFAMWLIIEVCLVSSFVVIVTNVGIPMLIMKDVRQIQGKVVQSIKVFYKEVQKQNRESVLQKSRLMEQQRLLTLEPNATAAATTSIVGDDTATQSEDNSFNAAKYLFMSVKVASCLPQPQLPIARMILRYRTVWPKQSYQHVGRDLSAGYNTKFSALKRSLSMIIFYF